MRALNHKEFEIAKEAAERKHLVFKTNLETTTVEIYRAYEDERLSTELVFHGDVTGGLVFLINYNPNVIKLSGEMKVIDFE